MQKGKFHRDASDRLCFEIFDFDAKDYKPLRKKLIKRFKLIPFGVTISTPDEIFQTYLKGFKRIGIEWDHWSGFIVVAKSKSSEDLVTDIGEYINGGNDITK